MNQNGDPGWLSLLPFSVQKRLAGRSNLHAIIHNSGWLFFDKAVRMALGLLVGAWVARYLGPSQYGELAYVLAYLAFFQAVANLGMDGIVVRDIARNKDLAGQILGTAFALRLAAGFLCWVIAILAMAILKGWHDRSVWLTALAGGTLVFQAADTIDLWFQSQSQSRRTVIAKLVAYLLSNGAKVSLILVHATLLGFAAVMVLDGLAAALGLLIAYHSFPSNRQWQHVFSKGIQLVKESWPFILGSLSIVVYMRIDQVMIKGMLGERELGVYAAVLPLSTIWQFVPMTLSASLAPFVARKKTEDQQAYQDLLGNIFRVFSLLGWLVCVPITVFSTTLVSVLFGPEYYSGGVVLAIYVFTNLFINLGVAQSLWLLNERKSKLGLYKALIGAVVCIGGNLVLIPIMGLVGVAIVGVLSQLASAVLSNLLFAPNIFKLQVRSLALLKHGLNN